MAAPRKYSDAQRQALFRHYVAGKNAAEISRICEQGMAGVAPFAIPRRTVNEIVTSMAAEAELDPPNSIDDEGVLEAIGRFPERIARMVNDELERLEARQKRSGFKPEDFARLRSVHDLSSALNKRVKRSPAGTSRRPGKAGRQEQPESALERLVREQGERPGGKAELSHARTSPPPVDLAPPEPDVPTTGGAKPRRSALDAIRSTLAEHGYDLDKLVNVGELLSRPE